MDVTDINDSGFSFTGTWNPESGDQFINGTNKYANPGATAALKFHGTRAWLVGTIDPNHGTADIYVDDKFVETINMNGPPENWVRDSLTPAIWPMAITPFVWKPKRRPPVWKQPTLSTMKARAWWALNLLPIP